MPWFVRENCVLTRWLRWSSGLVFSYSSSGEMSRVKSDGLWASMGINVTEGGIDEGVQAKMERSLYFRMTSS